MAKRVILCYVYLPQKKKKTWEKDDVSKKKYFHVTTIILKFTYLK